MPAYGSAPITVAKMQGYDGTNWQNLLVQSSDYPNLKICVASVDKIAAVLPYTSDNIATDNNKLATASALFGFNGSTYDRLRSNDGQTGITASDIGFLRVVATLWSKAGGYWYPVSGHVTAGPFDFTAAGTTGGWAVNESKPKHTWTVISDSSGTNMTIRLEGSLDNSNWFTLDEFVGVGNTMRHVVNKPVPYLRFNVVDMGDATSITLRCVSTR